MPNTVTENDIKNYIYLNEYKKKYGFYPVDKSEINITQSEYKLLQHQQLKYINFFINIVYYSLLILLFLLLFSSNNLYLKERAILYIFLIILPFLYPWIFMGLMQIKNMLFSNKPLGPSNAFVDIN